MFLSIVNIVLLPIALGITANIFFNKQVRQSVKAMPLVSVIAIVAIVTAVVSGNQQQIAEKGLLILIFVMFHNIIGFLLGLLIVRWFNYNYYDIKTFLFMFCVLSCE